MPCKGYKNMERKLDKLIESDEEVHEMYEKNHKKMKKKPTLWGYATK